MLTYRSACGLWLHKFKSMRPEHKWNKTNNANNSKRKRPPRRNGPLTNAATRCKPLSAKPAASSPGATDASSPADEEGPTPRTEKDDNDGQDPPSKRRRANSLEHRKNSNPMEALRRAIQSSPARNAPTTDENSLTPKPVKRNLFPASQNEGPLKTLGDSIVNSPRRSPRIASRESDKRSHDKENHVPEVHNDLDCLFEGAGFDLELPASPTPKRRNPRANALGEKRLALPYNSPTSRRRKDLDSDLSPTKLTAQKLQRIQESPSRQNKSPKQARSNSHDVPSLPDNSLDIVVDIFDGDGANDDTSFLFDPKNGNWADWMASDYVSPMGSDADQQNGDDQDLINLILSDPGFQNENNPFGDSSLFGSDFLDLGVKTNNKENHASPNDASASA